MKLFGHRGARDLVPENTMPAFEFAWTLPVDGIELDVQLTKDEKVVVIHDTNTKRTAGVDLQVKDVTFDELRALDFGIFKGPKFKGYKIPLFEEVISKAPRDRIVEIEIKSEVTIIPYLKELLQKYNALDMIILTSFKYDVVTALRQNFPKVPVQWIQASKTDPLTQIRPPYSPDLITKAKVANVTGLSLNVAALEDSYVEKVLSAGLRLHVWQMSSREIYYKYTAMGAYGASTDNPVEFNHKTLDK
ncbi:MAG: glycerophosphodiester phosphodiesterase family protein [Elusimicrobiota bacterium]